MSWNDITPSSGEVPVLEFLGIWHTPSLPLHPGPGVVAPDRVLSMAQIEMFDI